MKNNGNNSKDEIDMFKDIEFNRDEIKGADETFFIDQNQQNNPDNSIDLEEKENSISSDKLDICDKSMEEEMNKVTLKSNDDIKINIVKPKITKNDLNTIPLPIFDCIYCANEKVAFNHLINEEFYLKYLYNAEKKDICMIDLLLKNSDLVSLVEGKNKSLQNLLKKNSISMSRFKDIVQLFLKNREYVYKYYNRDESHNYIKQKRKRDIYDIKKKDIKKDFDNFDFKKKKYGIENNGLFKDDSDSNNSDSLEKINQITDKIIENENINSQNNKMDKNTEEKMCNGFNRLLDVEDEEDFLMDLSRKIKWKDIKFEEKPYNIWEINSIEDDIDELEKDS